MIVAAGGLIPGGLVIPSGEAAWTLHGWSQDSVNDLCSSELHLLSISAHHLTRNGPVITRHPASVLNPTKAVKSLQAPAWHRKQNSHIPMAPCPPPSPLSSSRASASLISGAKAVPKHNLRAEILQQQNWWKQNYHCFGLVFPPSREKMTGWNNGYGQENILLMTLEQPPLKCISTSKRQAHLH